jgi:hypothetical protein
MDAVEQLVFESDIAVGVLGNAGEFILVPVLGIEPDNDTDTAKEQAIARGWHYCGVLAIKDGVPKADCEPDPDSILCCLLASLAFARLVCDRLKPLPTSAAGDAVDFLTRLHELQDTRDERQLKIAARLRALSTR